MPVFIRLVDYYSPEEKERKLLCKKLFYHANQKNFKEIPGQPIGYWIHEKSFIAFKSKHFLSDLNETREGMATADNDRFLRLWTEPSFKNINFSCANINECRTEKYRWYPYHKGGGYRKWFGNNYYCVDWQNDGEHIRNNYDISTNRLRSHNYNGEYSFIPGLTWNSISSESISVRYATAGFLFDSKGAKAFSKVKFAELSFSCALLNNKTTMVFLALFSPNLDYKVGDILKIPIPKYSLQKEGNIIQCTLKCITISKSDWDLRETSWDFHRSPFLTNYNENCIETVIDENLTDWSWPSAFKPGGVIDLMAQVESFKNHWTNLFCELHRNEEENNRIFIELYGLQEELTPDVPYTEITILQEELVESARREQRIEFDESVLAKQFVSYGVGCLMGRYSVDKDGLILADAGSTLDDFILKVPNTSFLPDEDAILPLTDEDDFSDDLPTRFKTWLRVLSGKNFEDNLRWIEDRLGKDLRSYFIRDFYKDHLRRYKNRPIYWMISSPSGSFRTLMYLHRYTKDTVGKVLNDYLRPYRNKIEQKLRGLQGVMDSTSASQNEKLKAKKRATQLEKISAELDMWEKDFVYPTALARIELDLDDGVKVNYRKLSAILEPVKQLEQKEEE